MFKVRPLKAFVLNVIHVASYSFIALHSLWNSATTCYLSLSLTFSTYYFLFLYSLFLFNILFHLVQIFATSEKKTKRVWVQFNLMWKERKAPMIFTFWISILISWSFFDFIFIFWFFCHILLYLFDIFEKYFVLWRWGFEPLHLL